jgi:hypothetical protein
VRSKRQSDDAEDQYQSTQGHTRLYLLYLLSLLWQRPIRERQSMSLQCTKERDGQTPLLWTPAAPAISLGLMPSIDV